MSNVPQIDAFIARWKDTGGSEHANYQLFVIELTELLGLDRPNPATDDDSNDHYRFERPVRGLASVSVVLLGGLGRGLHEAGNALRAAGCT
jgi:hypothetical protein